MEDPVDAFQADRDHRHAQSGSHHADTGAKRRDLAMVGALPYGKDEHRKAVADQLSRIPKRLSRARLALRQRKRVEDRRRQVVLEAACEPLSSRIPFWEKVRLEKFLR